MVFDLQFERKLEGASQVQMDKVEDLLEISALKSMEVRILMILRILKIFA
jgi:hypothetical protein